MVSSVSKLNVFSVWRNPIRSIVFRVVSRFEFPEVNILPFVRMKHLGTITWLWGRITVGANCVIFAEF